ncbi:MAG: ABC transporter permease [Clostridia bacterium]|jgi:spermidine/putrescine transport system permease protein|nr:ABC transporter permease [Clostridia bacterium]
MTKNTALKKAISAPYLVWAALFIIVPLIFVVYYSLVDAGGAFTLDYIKSIGRYKDIMLNSIWLGFVATIICLVIAYPLAYIMARSTKNVQRTMMMLVMLPMWMNLLIRTYSLMILLQDTGILNSVFSFLHLPERHMINTRGAVILGMVYNYIPYMILPLYSIMAKIDYGLVEAAQDLGASRTAVLRKVILPLSLPGIASGFTMVFVPSVSTFYISKKLGGSTFSLIGDIIEMQFKSANNYNLGAALSLILMVLILLCMAIMNRFTGEDDDGGVLI